MLRKEGMLLIDADLARGLVRDQFPHWSGLPVEAVRPGGWDNRTFRLGSEMLVRLPSAAHYVAQVDKEHRWLPVLAAHLPLQIPKPIAKGLPALGYPWSWSIYKWIEGRPAAAHEIADLNAFASTLAFFLNALWSIDAREGPLAGEHNFHRGGELSVYDAQVREALAALPDQIGKDHVRDVWAAALRSRWQRPPVWVHGDIAWGNLLVRDGKLTAVIDFGSSAVGDPACDLVIAWTLFDETSRRVFREAVALDSQTWARARGWALWKALIIAAGHDSNQADAAASWHVIDEVIKDHWRSGDGFS